MASSADNTVPPRVLSDWAARCLPVSEIDDEDPTFRITTRTNFDDLSPSIDCLGLIHPPILKPSASGFIVVSGFRRIAACRALRWNRMPVCVLPSNCSPLDTVHCAIADNALQRTLNLVEVSRCVNLLAGVVRNDAQLLAWATCLQLPRSLEALRRIQPLCRFPQSIQNGVLAETISLPMALELAALDEDMGSAFAHLFDVLRISLNKQREILLLVREIALREDVPLSSVLNEDAPAGILSNPDLDRGQQARMIRNYLRRRRYPNIAEAESRFASRVKELNLGQHLKLIPPNDFEGTGFIFELRFADLPELENRLKQLAAIIGRRSLKEILE
jgi:ParB family chromosome partitioning protein